MKAHDLIHGGLYLIGDSQIVRFNALNGCFYTLDGDFFGSPFADVDSGEIECFTINKNWLKIFPIPLTSEILEKNGFKAVYAHEDYRYEDKMLLTQSYDKQGYWWVVGNMYVCQLHFVHELQRALRCCGLWDLVDNLQV